MKKRILFLCTGNSVRSQMAEGLTNSMHGDAVEAVSAGSRPSGWVHPYAVRAMEEIGIDISAAQSKNASAFLDQPFDVVVTVCDSAAIDCPSWPGARRLEHWPIPDPSIGAGDTDGRFAEVRNDLSRRIDELVATL
jgi:arsenate reductase